MENSMQKRYGLFTAISMVVGIVIGSGIFFKATKVLANNNGDMGRSLLTVGIVGAIMLICSFVFANLASRYEKVNGVVDYAEAALGRGYAYYVAWFMTLIYYPTITSTLGWVTSQYAAILFGFPVAGMTHYWVGFGILLAGEKGLVAAQVVDSFNEVSMKIMDLIIKLSPIGVACLICPVIVENGPKILAQLVAVLAVAYVGYIVHAVVVYSSTVKALGGVSPIAFFKGMAPAMMMAFSSASSVGTLPFTLECSERLGARKEVASFVLPLGATINMDGTAIYQGVCAVFIASCYGIDLTIGQMATIVLTATLASIGTAGVPGAGMVMLAMVLQSVNIPVEGIALVAGIDRIFDMGRTTINITGDAACAVVVSKMEDRKVARTKSVLG